jgi:GT2 family glycosyltransferase
MIKEPQSTIPIDCSIIIPNLHSRIIDRTILSILKQETKYSYEIIVVGLDKFGLVAQFPEVNFIETETVVFPGVARNIGASNAFGEFLLFVDSDCIVKPNWLETHLQFHHEAHHRLLIGGGVTFPQTNYFTLSDNISSFHEYMIHLPPREMILLPSINLSLPKSIWKELNGFIDTQAGEDTDFTFRARLKKSDLLFNPAAIVEHHPDRKTFSQICVHTYRFGLNSIKANPKFWKDLKFPRPLRIWWVALLTAPLQSTYIILKLIFKERLPIKYWHTLPIIFILKIIWVIGFTRNLRTQKGNDEK